MRDAVVQSLAMLLRILLDGIRLLHFVATCTEYALRLCWCKGAADECEGVVNVLAVGGN